MLQTLTWFTDILLSYCVQRTLSESVQVSLHEFFHVHSFRRLQHKVSFDCGQTQRLGIEVVLTSQITNISSVRQRVFLKIN